MNNLYIADAARVIEWANENPRRPAHIAFTDGPERQAAYWIEWVENRRISDSSEQKTVIFNS